MNRIIPILVVLIGLVSCENYEFDLQGSSSEASLYSSTIEDDFKIYTYLPGNYDADTEYPVIFLLDGDWYFEDFVRELNDLLLDEQVEPSILIGIGYSDNINLNRFRDYTFPEDPEYDIVNGDADRFSQFLKEELVPKIEADYSVDRSKMVLMGHSLGGLNTLYNMLQLDSPFMGYVAVSSSIWWNNGFLFGIEEQFFTDATDLPANLYISVGGDEPPSMTALNEAFIERLNTRNYDRLKLESQFFEGASHSQVPMIGFKNGIQFVLN